MWSRFTPVHRNRDSRGFEFAGERQIWTTRSDADFPSRKAVSSRQDRWSGAAQRLTN